MLCAMLRTLTMLWILLLLVPAQAGLFGGNDAPGRIPVPARDFSAVILDDAGVSVSVSRLTLDGEVFLFGELGKAQVTVPFEEVVVARFDEVDGQEHTRVVVQTRSGDEITVLMKSDRPVFGRTTFGNYRIEVADIATLTLSED